MGQQTIYPHHKEQRQAENNTVISKSASATLGLHETMVKVTLPAGATDVTLTLPPAIVAKGLAFYIWIGTKTGTGKLIVTDGAGFQRTLHTEGQAIFVLNEAGKRYVGGTGEAGEQMVKIALGASDAAAGVLSWQNKTGKTIRINRLIVNRTTASSSAGTADFGVASTAVIDDTLIDGLDTNATAGIADNHLNPGSNGLSGAYLPADHFVTGSMKTGAMAGLVGFAYIFYTPLV